MTAGGVEDWSELWARLSPNDLAALRARVGPETFEKMSSAISGYDDLMRRVGEDIADSAEQHIRDQEAGER